MILSSQYIEALPLQVQDEINAEPKRLIAVRRFDDAESPGVFSVGVISSCPPKI